MLPDDSLILSKMLDRNCAICGGTTFTYREILWRELVDEWQLSPDEVRYINIQQGFSCANCGNNLRSMTLARSICWSQHYDGVLDAWVASPGSADCKILEINEAGLLTKHLATLSDHTLITYPDIDIHALPYPTDVFDLVIHSDTLEHVANPEHALGECRRVLKQGGTLAFTVPVVSSRMSRVRAGLPPSHHGIPSGEQADHIVQTEFGADVWSVVIKAGFTSVTIQTDIFPASIAFVAKK